MNTRIYLILLFFCLTTVKQAAASCEIRLHRRAILTPGPICLRDVADVKTQDSDQKSRLESLIIAQYPQPVMGISIGVFDISQAMAQANLNPAAACIYGASSCRLTFHDTTPLASVPSMEDRPNDTFNKSAKSPEYQTLADQLTRAVVRLSGMDASKLKVQWNCTRPKLLEQKADDRRFEIKPCSTSTLGEVRFEVTDRGLAGEGQDFAYSTGGSESVRVYGRVEYLCQSVVAKRCLKPGGIICAEDVELRPRRVTSYRDIGVSDLDAVLGQEVARTIAAQGIILPSMIRKLQIVKRHQLVEIYSRAGSVQVKVTGKALEDGAYGDTIPVSFGKQKIVVHGKVTGPGEVIVTRKPSETSEQMASAVDRSRFNRFIKREKQ
jgi:flagella basal body P-ring formation protein FlgA